EAPLAQEALDRYELAALHLPIADQTAPSPEQFVRALGFIDGQQAQGRAVVVHCRMGQGRTAIILAAHLVRAGITPQEALRCLRPIWPCAVRAPAQERALESFAARREWFIGAAASYPAPHRLRARLKQAPPPQRAPPAA